MVDGLQELHHLMPLIQCQTGPSAEFPEGYHPLELPGVVGVIAIKRPLWKKQPHHGFDQPFPRNSKRAFTLLIQFQFPPHTARFFV